MRPEPKVLVVGLDCLEPSLVFERWRAHLPHLSALMDAGTWGPLRSCDPPITVPAWSCMLSGRDPGELGIYGFKNRRGWSYETTLPGPVAAPRIFDLVSRAGRPSLVVGVPQTWPPPVLEGALVSGFLAPGTGRPFTHPPELAGEIRARVGEYLLDVEDFRSGDRARVLADLHRMTEQRVTLMEAWLRERPWSFAMLVEIGPDRIHHGFWGDEAIVRAYYERLDAGLGRLLSAAGPGAHVLVVSDHGARTLEGGVRINGWLEAEGWLVLRTPGEGPLDPAQVDWSRTRAWGEGGYAGRVFVNLRGREGQGVVAPGDYDNLRGQIAEGLAALVPGTEVHRPEDLWRARAGFPPDLLVYFGGLSHRALGTLGPGPVVVGPEAVGGDGANHAKDGVFVLREAGAQGAGRLEGLVLQDVFQTALSLLELAPPAGTHGTSRAHRR